MSEDDLKDYIITTHGDLSTITRTWEIMFNSYITKHQNEIDRMYSATRAIYNPLDNNDVTTETVTLNKTDSSESKPTETKINEYNKSYDAGLEKTSYTENESVSPAIITPHNTLSETFQSEENNGYNNTSKTLERKHGNISSVTNQSIINQELDLRLREWLYPLIDHAVFYGGVYYEN